jgi:hypothetical protein
MTHLLTSELSFPRAQIIVLRDAEATKTAILDSYIGLREKAFNIDDRVLVFFAGHGVTVKGSRGPIGYLVPVDGDPDRLNTLIRWDDFTRNAEILPAKHILFIIDACYSGLAIQRAITPGTQRFISDMLQRNSRQVITAGKANETVSDGGGPTGSNSIFTGYLLEGLRGAASDAHGVLTANLLMNYVYQKVGQDARSDQTPHYGHVEGDGDFILRAPHNEHLRPDADDDHLVATVHEVPESTSYVPETPIPSFAIKNNYADPDSANFGRNEWSARLGESKFNPDGWEREVTRAYSWLSLIAEPSKHIQVNIKDEVARLNNRRSEAGEPYEQFRLPRRSMTTIDSVVFYGNYYANESLWGHYLRLHKSGNIEYADSNCVFADFEGVRRFEYVRVVGLTWQFMFLVKDVLANADYRGGIRLLVNLVGTRGSILGNFSKGKGNDNNVWADPSDRGSRLRDFSQLSCLSTNLQMEYDIIIGNLEQVKSKEIINDVAEQLGLAFNHGTAPRCFNYGTLDFPWLQYLNEIRYCGESQK